MSAAALSAEREPLFRIEHAWLGYGRNIVLADVHVDLHADEFWCFVGANGTGKTTLIKALLGALTPRAGRIVRRADFAGANRVGYVPQHSELRRTLPTMDGELAAAGFAGLPTTGALVRGRVRQALEHVGLARAERADFWSMSGGQRQRALIARALVRDPRVLIVDEPLAGLDLASARSAVALMERLHARHAIAVIFVTHDLQLASDRATHVAQFREGTVVAGRADVMLTDAELTRTFGVPIAVVHGAAGRRISHLHDAVTPGAPSAVGDPGVAGPLRT